MGAHCGLSGRAPARAGRLVLLCAVLALGPARPAHAHPVPRGSHDRNVTVRLAADGVTVHYHLELDRWTLIFEDLKRVEDRVPVAQLSEPHELYGAFTRTAAADLAAGLSATLDGRPLTFACVRQEYADRDSVQCDFQFRAAWELEAGRSHAFAFRDGTYLKQPGVLKLTLEAAPSARLLEKSEPDESLQARPEKDLSDEERERLRSVTATVEANPDGGPDDQTGASSAEGGSRGGEEAGLVRLFLHSRQGPWLLLLLSAGLGAAHALTPGHGKTLVAAYLVGERGTTAHAVVLGLVTTLTHTGVVLVLALVLRLCFPQGMDASTRQGLHRALELVGGLLIAGLGLWLLLRRLAGQADHVHIGGGHHHHHGPGGHHHHHHHAMPERVGWWGLITLGVSGGIVPCWDAVALLLAALALNLLWWALPMLLAFSAGLAGVLVLIGLLVVHTRALAGARFENSRLFRALPLCSAVAVTGLGLWLCYSSLHAG